MGKLLDALKKRRKELEDYIKQPHPSYDENPGKAYEFIHKVNDLNYLMTQSGEILTAAFTQMTPEQRLQFFKDNLNDARKNRLAEVYFSGVVMEAANNGPGEAGLRTFFSDEKNFGRPLAELLPMMEQALDQNQLEELNQELGQDADPVARAVGIYNKMDYGQKGRIFEQMITPERRAQYFAEYVENAVQRGKIGSLLLNDSAYRKGKTWIDGVEALEKLMAPELIEQTASKIEGLVPPQQDPNRTFEPYRDRIETLRADIAPEDPQAQEKQELLDRAAKHLVYPTQTYLHHLDAKTQSINDQKGLQSLADGYGFAANVKFLNQALEAELLNKLPHQPSPTGVENYDAVNVVPRHRHYKIFKGTNLNDQEVEELRNKGAGEMNPEARRAILDVLHGIEELGEKKYWINGVVSVVEGTQENPTKVFYTSEQGDKKYAFWPLVNAKKALADAVEQGDFARIREATEEYERCKAITDKMMEAANRSTKDPVFCGNLNSTRDEQDHARPNPMPTEYLEDYAGHSRVNGVFLLYALSKNTGVPAERFLDDPAGTIQELGRQFVSDNLLSSQKGKSLGARLVHGFDDRLQNEKEIEWNLHQGFFSRAMSTVAGFLPTEEERVRETGRRYCAVAAANYEVGKEAVAWKCLANASGERKQIVTQLALLLPEEEFDLADVGRKLGNDDWSKHLNTVSTIDRLQKEGKLDCGALVERSKQLLSDANAALQKNDEDILQNEETPGITLYQKAALRNYHQIMRTASAELRQTEGYKKMAAHAVELQDELIRQSAKGYQGMQKHRGEISKAIEILEQEKSGWFLSKTNSEEYNLMMKRIKRFNVKLDMLTGKEVTPESTGLKAEELEELRKTDTADLLFDAKRACFNYASEKTKKGTGGFIHEAGEQRYKNAVFCFDALGILGENLGLRSPAVTLKDEIELETLRRRGSKKWTQKDAEIRAAKIIYAMTLQYKGIPEEKQEKLLEEEHLNSAVEKIRSDPAFKKMVRNEGAAGLTDKIIEGTSFLTDAYMKASEQIKNPQAGKQPQRTNQQKIEFWRDSPSPAKDETAQHVGT